MIKTPVDTAEELLELLNCHYEATGDEKTKGKIIELVDSELEQVFISQRDASVNYIGISAVVTLLVFLFVMIFVSDSFAREHTQMILTGTFIVFVMAYIGARLFVKKIAKSSIFRIYNIFKPNIISDREKDLILKYSVKSVE